MNPRRKLARATNKHRTGKKIEQTLGELGQQMANLGGLGEMSEVIEGLKVQTARAKQIADMMETEMADYQELRQRVVALEEEVAALKGTG